MARVLVDVKNQAGEAWSCIYGKATAANTHYTRKVPHEFAAWRLAICECKRS